MQQNAEHEARKLPLRNRTQIVLRYTLSIGGKAFRGRALLRETELRGLPQLPTDLDHAIVTYDPVKPRRSFLWGFVFRNGAAWVPGLPKT